MMHPVSPASARASGQGYQTLSAPDGSFVIADLGRDRHQVWAEHPAFPKVSVAGVAGGTNGLVLHMKAGVLVTGRVVEEEGRPVAGFLLSAEGPRGRTERIFHDPAGGFELRLPPGPYRLQAESVFETPKRVALEERFVATEEKHSAPLELVARPRAEASGGPAPGR
jgi:hypothetical protein